jgi:putative transposase
MLTEIQFFQYLDRHQIQSDAREYLISIRNQQASRMVGAYAKNNSCSWTYSEKMQRTISSESRGAERAYIISAEWDDEIIEIWDQPEPIIIVKHTRKRKQVNASYTPDFLVLTLNGPKVIEVKDINTVSANKPTY